MFWLIIAVMVLVVGAAALVALGGGGTLPEAERDRLSVRLPLDRPLVRTDVDTLRFPMALRGYRMDEVDDVLDRLGAELALRDGRVAELDAALTAALADAHAGAGASGAGGGMGGGASAGGGSGTGAGSGPSADSGTGTGSGSGSGSGTDADTEGGQ